MSNGVVSKQIVADGEYCVARVHSRWTFAIAIKTC